VKVLAKITCMALFCGILFAASGCSSVDVNYDYDTNVDWDTYQTYAWMGGSTNIPSPSGGALLDSGLLDQRIRKSVEWEMDQRKIAPSGDANFLVIYHLGTEEQIQVTDWGYRYSDYYWGYGGRQIDVYQFTQGTLVIDIIDGESKNLIWRGTASGAVDQGKRTPEEMQKDIDDVVNKIMANFPPPGR
jgi:hypothetical protein